MTKKLWRLTLIGLICAAAPGLASATEVWIGGGLAWNEIDNPAVKNQWQFVRENATGFYINNFATRFKNPAELAKIEKRLATTAALFAHKNAFYETDLRHSTDAQDRVIVPLFGKAGFTLTRTTINYGNSPARTAIITEDGRIPLYYMFGPWDIGGNIKKTSNAKLRKNILASAGAAVDGPVTMWRKDARFMHNACYTTIAFCHAHHKKFLYLLAPNESGQQFLTNAKQVVHGMEDHYKHPDFWAVSFYGPAVFRKHLNVLPEADAHGKPVPTFMGVTYWLIHHLKDPEHWVRLQPPIINHQSVELTMVNASPSIDMTPVLRVRCSAAAHGQIRAMIDGHAYDQQELSAGIEFSGDLRLNPGDQRRIVLRFPTRVAVYCTAELMPSYGEKPEQRVRFTVPGNGRGLSMGGIASRGTRRRLGSAADRRTTAAYRTFGLRRINASSDLSSRIIHD